MRSGAQSVLAWQVSEPGSVTEQRSDEEFPAEEGDEESDQGEPWHRTPVATMFKSVLIPGWGQWSNGKHVKSGVIFATEGYLIYRALRAAQRESEAEDDAVRFPGREDEFLAVADRWNEEKRDYAWWTIFALVLSMGDAYVDAHLRGFDVEFEEEGNQFRLQYSVGVP